MSKFVVRPDTAPNPPGCCMLGHRASPASLCLAVWAALLPALAAAGDGLAELARVREGRSGRVSSASDNPLSNRDNLWIPAGQTQVLADIQGPATITHIWLTFSEARPNWISAEGSAAPDEMVLRMYWDEGEHPAIETPLGDFFAAGFGVRSEVKSIPVAVESGDSYNCYWHMPFFKRGRITLTNESDRRVNAFYYHVDYVRQESLPPETAYFCAQYRNEFPERTGRDYLILDAEGRGQYVGTVLSARSRSPEWFGEGDEKFYIDGEKTPSVWGTGTEDFVSCAWGLSECAFPYFGVPLVRGDWGEVGAMMCAYRWHVADAVRFTKSLRVEIEHWGWMSADETETGKVEGHVEREDDLATVAFWYQVGQPKRFTELPPLAQRRWPNLDHVIEGKDLRPGVKHSAGTLELQKGYEWTGDGQLFFRPEEHGVLPAGGGVATSAPAAGRPSSMPFLEFEFRSISAEKRRLFLRLTHSYDYGTYQVLLDNVPIGKPLDLYSKDIQVHDHGLGEHDLTGKARTLRLQCVGRNPASTGCFLGVDSVRFRERWLKKRPVPKL